MKDGSLLVGGDAVLHEPKTAVKNSMAGAYGKLSSALSDAQYACDRLIEEFNGKTEPIAAVRMFERNMVMRYKDLLKYKTFKID